MALFPSHAGAHLLLIVILTLLEKEPYTANQITCLLCCWL